jgi:hypothetical protein
MFVFLVGYRQQTLIFRSDVVWIRREVAFFLLFFSFCVLFSSGFGNVFFAMALRGEGSGFFLSLSLSRWIGRDRTR